ncbi:MAG: SDR family oxidoreductase [Synergistes sp.]|nr:SDR family oxidoreductase [Synergistes sp.]MCR5335245.1 SDR family oxidoreductase [Synergistes sp.]
MINPMDLTGKKIFLTGASSGIGRQTAIHLSRLGASLVIASRREDALREVISLMDGGPHSYCPIDLSDIDSIEAKIKETAEKEGPFDGFVHCAGVGDNRPLQQLKFENAHRIMLVSYYAFLELVRVLTKRGRYRQGFSIVGISSIATKTCRPSQTAYAAAKSAMDAAMRCLALELSPKGIRINTVAPAMIATEMYETFKRKYNYDEAYMKREGRMGVGETTDVANAVAFLLSDAAKFITRSCVEVTGGDH